VWTEACIAISPAHFQRGRLGEQTLHRGMGCIALAQVVESNMEHQGDMRVVEAMKNLLACATALD
jgi:hypothetical protein